ncbi:spliceosome-associated protein CWC27 homolog [Clytia hemisphaerica]|uniref:Spliceosome-associated protein CWC27 homolog n=1 Tax=Clytia hemisphaerica TaxID=252671 RepID=A0A7M5X276_9CNID
MSNIYIQEPPTNGKVLMKTSLGEIDIELWSKETPKACRNFIQLCMEGYYDETAFHRVVKGFIAQGGDPTGTGTGGESIYGAPFKDEFHQRLKFNRRGLVAMANAGKDDNASQFFFTLDRTEELQKKHTIFGKVTGNTIYNMIRFNDLEVDQEDRPLSPPKILKTEILSNPFEDIEPRDRKKKKQKDDSEKAGKIKSKSKATKNYKLLSFGEEAEDDENEDESTEDFGIKSSHDVLKEDKKLSALPAVDENTLKRKDQQLDSASIARKKLKKDTEVSAPQKEDLFRNKQKVENGEDEEEKKKAERRKALQEEAKQLKKELKSKTSSFTDADPKQERDDKKKKKEPINDLMKQLTEERDQYKNKKKKEKLLRKGDDRQAETLALLQSFQSSIASKIEENSTNNENETNEEDDDDEGWLTHKLEFEKDPELSGAKDANMKGDDWYDIYDPRNPMNQRRREKSKKSSKSSKR